MPVFEYLVADVFTDRPYGGNPLAVFPDAAGLSTAQMQAIAREMNLSETTFVTPGSGPGRFAMRIFTPGRELPFAGHPIVGTCIALKSLGRIPGDEVTLEIGVGPVRVEVGAASATFFRDGAPDIAPVAVPDAEIAAALGVPALAGAAFEGGYGTSFLYAPLPDRAAVAAAALRLDLWRAMAPRLSAHAVYLYALTGAGRVHARLFAPGMGVTEDPATGSAAAGLAGSLPGPEGTQAIAITQGVEMGRPSLIQATATRASGIVTGISIGGGTVVVAEGRLLRLP
jgi:trans-2,3-dihydro-3-hydroxyanthranilate isomerase